MGKPALRIGLLVALVALVRDAGAQSTAASASAPPAAALTAPMVVTLITGDRVALAWTADGRPVVAFDGASSTQTGYQTLTYNSHVYVIPYDAAAYLGPPLDLSLFDVTA